MSNILIFEGVDKSGKSTAASIIAKQQNCPIIKGLSAKTPEELETAGNKLLSEVEQKAKENQTIIVDRMHIFSEPVYNQKLGTEGYEDLTAQYDKVLTSLEGRFKALCQEHNVHIFIFTAEPQIILGRMAADGGPADELEEEVKKDVVRYLECYDNLYTGLYLNGFGDNYSKITSVNLVESLYDPEVIKDKILQAVQYYSDHNHYHRVEPLKFAAIVPKSVKLESDFALILAQNLIDNVEQQQYWKNFKGYKVLDNGAFELGASIEFPKLLQIATEINADEVVLPDVFRDAKKTVKLTEEALAYIQEHNLNIKVMAVPQGNTLGEWLVCYKQFLNDPRINVVAINRDSSKFYNSRLALLDILQAKMGLDKKWSPLANGKEIHLLGMADSFGEVREVAKKYPWVRSMDSCFPYIIAKTSKHDVGTSDVYNIDRKSLAFTIDFEEVPEKEVIDKLITLKEILRKDDINI